MDYNQPLSTVCSSQEQGYYVGSAQQITGCCREVTIKGACEWISEWKQGREVLRKECAPDETNCAQNYYTTYACKSTCTATAPAAPTLMSPSNGSSQSGTTASLLWNSVSSWGTACSGANNQYYVYLGTTNPPNYYTTVAGNVTSLNAGNLTRGATYYWQITASNGQLYSSSGVRSFTILNNQIAGTVLGAAVPGRILGFGGRVRVRRQSTCGLLYNYRYGNQKSFPREN